MLVEEHMIKANLKQLKTKKLLWAGIAAAILVIALVTTLVVHGGSTKGSASETTVQSAAAERGSISTTIVGTGALDNTSTKDVAIPTGITIEKILVEEGETVKKGQELATVNEASVAAALLEVRENIDDVEDEMDDLSSSKVNDSSTIEYLKAKVLNGQLEELEESKEKLESLMDAKVITASCAGTISGIYVTEGEETLSSDNENTDDNNGVENASVMNTSTENASTHSGIMLLTADTTTQDSVDNTEGDNGEGDNGGDIDENSNEAENSATKISECSIDVSAPITGEEPQTKILPSDYFTGTISWNCATKTFQANTAYTATIILTAKEGYGFSKNILPKVEGADVTSQVGESDAGESVLAIKAKFAKTAAIKEDTTASDKVPATGNSGEKQVTENAGEKQDAENASGQQGSGNAAKTPSSSSSRSVSGSASAGTSGTSGSSSASADTSSQDSTHTMAAFSIASQNEMSVSINVDELDILSVKKGQSAVVTLDALENQQFEGSITGVSVTASGEGSSVKYPVQITVDKAEGMLQGMSASATIQVDESENAILIPVSALQERGNTTFVYTQADDDGNLSGETEVETGLSNGSQVEITSGLEEGATVYYLRVEKDNEERNMGGMPGGDGTSNRGDMPPGGGDMKGNRQGGQRGGEN